MAMQAERHLANVPQGCHAISHQERGCGEYVYMGSLLQSKVA
jgi:hypothetical protein